MASTSEVGNAKNVANFQDLIEFVTAYGVIYSPSKNSLKIAALNAQHAAAAASLNDVINKNTEYNNRVNERMIAFSDLKPLSTRLLNALEVTDASNETIKDAKTFNRKMQGKKALSGQTPTDPNQPAPATISSSQQSYDQLIQHLAGLNAILAAEPSYSPNESELRVSTIEAKIANLTAKNTAVANAYAAISNSRIERNQILYSPQEGLVETAAEVKKYVKSVFGATSPQFAQIKGIKFSNPKP